MCSEPTISDSSILWLLSNSTTCSSAIDISLPDPHRYLSYCILWCYFGEKTYLFASLIKSSQAFVLSSPILLALTTIHFLRPILLTLTTTHFLLRAISSCNGLYIPQWLAAVGVGQVMGPSPYQIQPGLRHLIESCSADTHNNAPSANCGQFPPAMAYCFYTAMVGGSRGGVGGAFALSNIARPSSSYRVLFC